MDELSPLFPQRVQLPLLLFLHLPQLTLQLLDLVLEIQTMISISVVCHMASFPGKRCFVMLLIHLAGMSFLNLFIML